MYNRLEFHISYKCQNNCIFCGESFRLAQNRNKFVSFTEIKKELLQKKEKGAGHITLTGGEPTFHPDFLKILRFAKSIGFKTYVSTNGGMFAYEDFSRQAAPFLDEICFSIHGHDSKFHDLHTQNNRSFEILGRALDNFHDHLKETKGFSNTVVTNLNFKFLPDILRLASRKGISQMLFSNIVPEGSGSLGYNKLTVPLSSFAKSIPKLVELAESKNITARFFSVPLCIMPGFEANSNDVWWSPRLTIEKNKKKNELILSEVESALPVREKTKLKKCGSCREKDRCGGIFSRYIEEFGESEIIPFK